MVHHALHVLHWLMRSRLTIPHGLRNRGAEAVQVRSTSMVVVILGCKIVCSVTILYALHIRTVLCILTMLREGHGVVGRVLIERREGSKVNVAQIKQIREVHVLSIHRSQLLRLRPRLLLCVIHVVPRPY